MRTTNRKKIRFKVFWQEPNFEEIWMERLLRGLFRQEHGLVDHVDPGGVISTSWAFSLSIPRAGLCWFFEPMDLLMDWLFDCLIDHFNNLTVWLITSTTFKLCRLSKTHYTDGARGSMPWVQRWGVGGPSEPFCVEQKKSIPPRWWSIPNSFPKKSQICQQNWRAL